MLEKPGMNINTKDELNKLEYAISILNRKLTSLNFFTNKEKHPENYNRYKKDTITKIVAFIKKYKESIKMYQGVLSKLSKQEPDNQIPDKLSDSPPSNPNKSIGTTAGGRPLYPSNKRTSKKLR